MNEIQKALLESYRHWEDNVKSYPEKGSKWGNKIWFMDNCRRLQCPLCELFNKQESCNSCPMAPGACFAEYNELNYAIEFGTSRKHHVEAVRDTLQAECEKDGLL